MDASAPLSASAMAGPAPAGEVLDLAVIGGGVNGCGIARDAVGRGLSVAVLEQNDLASGTSSWSTKLIHGGLRYLEYYEFRLVREALIEREVLWSIAPHIVKPLRFVLPHHAGLRPAWLLRLGLFLYDHLGGRRLLPATTTVDLAHDERGTPLKPGFVRGFEYSDCFVDDARLVVLNARDAADRGAQIRTRTRVEGVVRQGALWQLDTLDQVTGERGRLLARALVDASGAWVGRLGAVEGHARVRLVQGSHIVVRKLFDHDRCYIFQNADRRIVFAIPYENDFTLIGTTDRDYTGDPKDVRASEEEISYLCAAVSDYFAKPVTPADVVWTYSGVRPLYDDGASEAQAATRDYVLERDAPAGAAPRITVYGGKITTYRRLAEAVLAKLAPDLPAAGRQAGWTAHAALPGGGFATDGRPALETKLIARHPALSPAQARRLVAAYGLRAFDIAPAGAGFGRDFGAGLTEAEVRFLVATEWAQSSDDILWRRTKLGLRMAPHEIAALDAFLAGLASGQSTDGRSTPASEPGGRAA